MRRIAALSIILGLAACASPAERITTALEDRGIPPKQARCMGDRLSDKLDYGQLKRLNELAKANPDAGKRSLNGFLDQLNQQGDPKLVSAVVRAGLHCAIG